MAPRKMMVWCCVYDTAREELVQSGMAPDLSHELLVSKACWDLQLALLTVICNKVFFIRLFLVFT